MLLNEKLRCLRDKSKETQQQLADYLGIDVSTYAHYEAGRRAPDIEKLRKLAIKYGMIDEMLGAELPIVVKQHFNKTDLEIFADALTRTNLEDGDNNVNRQQFEYLRKCAEPVLKEWNKSLSLPDLSISELENATITKRVELDTYAAYLISDYVHKCNEYFEKMFTNPTAYSD